MKKLPHLMRLRITTFIYITNTTEPKLSRDDMVGMFQGLMKK